MEPCVDPYYWEVICTKTKGPNMVVPVACWYTLSPWWLDSCQKRKLTVLNEVGWNKLLFFSHFMNLTTIDIYHSLSPCCSGWVEEFVTGFIVLEKTIGTASIGCNVHVKRRQSHYTSIFFYKFFSFFKFELDIKAFTHWNFSSFVSAN